MYIGLPLCWKTALQNTTPHYVYTYLFTVNSVSWHSRFDSHHMTVTWWSHTVYVQKYVRTYMPVPLWWQDNHMTVTLWSHDLHAASWP